MGSYHDEVLCDVIPLGQRKMLAMFFLGAFQKKGQFDRDVVHRGRSNEYELRDKGKKIVLKPMSPQAVRSMSTNRGKKPSPHLNKAAFASEREGVYPSLV